MKVELESEAVTKSSHAISVARVLGVTSESSLDAAHSATVGVAIDTFRISNRFAAKPHELLSEWDMPRLQDTEETSSLNTSMYCNDEGRRKNG